MYVLRSSPKLDSLRRMGKAFMRRANGALNGRKGFDQAREMLAQRLGEIDLEAMQKRGTKLAGAVRTDLQRRIRPKRRGPSPGAMIGLAGIALAGLAAAGVGFLAYDRDRRAAARKRLEEVRSGVRERYAELSTGRTKAEADLKEQVSKAIAEGGHMPDGLETAVEGRTVYLRGAVADAASVDAAAERAHGVPGVVAVVNLTTGRSNDQRSPASAAKS